MSILINAEKLAKDFQSHLVRDAIEKMGSQDALGRALGIKQQSVSRYKDGTNAMSVSKVIRIAKLAGMSEVTIKCQ